MHSAERIFQGQMPYRDFFLEYVPGYFYLLAVFYKVFGISLLTGRALSLVSCLGIFIASIYLLRAFDIISTKAKIVALVCIASFGYPLINIPNPVWPTVFVTELVMIATLQWFRTSSRKHLVSIGLFLALLFLIKQNIALVETVLVNLLLLVTTGKNIRKASISLLLMNSVWIIPTFLWLWYFFLRDNLPALYEFVAFNKRYTVIYPLTYPLLTMLVKPLGFIKLLPYYFPIVFPVLILLSVMRKKADKRALVLLLPIAGFFTTVIPTSDLLHVYPYYGLVLVSLFIFSASHFLKMQKVWFVLIAISIISGFYLTLFGKYYYYHTEPYRLENTPLPLPRAKGIFVDKASARSISPLATFINHHTKKSDYIFVYSFSPGLYFLLERPDPSPYYIFIAGPRAGYLTPDEEKATIQVIQKKKVAYIIDDGFAYIPTPLSKWIAQKKKLQQFGQYAIYDAQQ